jgi:hypothetical protein
MQGIRSIKSDMEPIIISRETEALAYAIEHADKGSFIVCSSDKVAESVAFVSAQQQQREYAAASDFN